MKTIHTHRGTCQTCGSQQAVGNDTGLIAKHGYKVKYGRFHFVCDAAAEKPAEHDVTLTHATIERCMRAAAAHEAEAADYASGKAVPAMFKRWNSNKVVVHKRPHGGGTYETRGDYDVLPIAMATAEERADRIKLAIAEAEMNAAGFRGHADNLKRYVLPRFGQPLFANEELSKKTLERGMLFDHEGHKYTLERPAVSTFGNRLIGWWVVRVGADRRDAVRWTTKEIRDAMNPKPVVADGGYKTKKARKDDLDKLNIQFDAARRSIMKVCLEVPSNTRTEAQNAVYWGPMQLSHWRPKHSAAALKEFPKLARVIQGIESLVADRARIKAAPGV